MVLGHNRGLRAAAKVDEGENEHEHTDASGRITKGPFTLKNGAVYTG